ncbi:MULTISPECIES: hypothetical protein [unclassified Mycobacterium]|nr:MULTISPECIES: hypothetical protein [unclassified Mycobacterium]
MAGIVSDGRDPITEYLIQLIDIRCSMFMQERVESAENQRF